MNFFKHLKTILVHKWYVFIYCLEAGLIWRGIVHDLSKFSPIEFFESIQFYQGTSSPIDEAKRINGYSKAWLHHRGRNTHHYEYWCDNFDNGTTCIPMPYEDAMELICDYLADGRTYMKKSFSYKAEYQWWLNKKKNIKMHKDTIVFVDAMLHIMAENNRCIVLHPKYAHQVYNFSHIHKKYTF